MKNIFSPSNLLTYFKYVCVSIKQVCYYRKHRKKKKKAYYRKHMTTDETFDLNLRV